MSHRDGEKQGREKYSVVVGCGASTFVLLVLHMRRYLFFAQVLHQMFRSLFLQIQIRLDFYAGNEKSEIHNLALRKSLTIEVGIAGLGEVIRRHHRRLGF